MTREQAETIVDDLVQAATDYEFYGSKYYRQELNEMRKMVIEALCPMPPAHHAMTKESDQ